MTSAMPDHVDHIVDGAPSIHDYVLDGTKVGWYAARVAAWQRGEKIAPITMDVAWTRKCNYACNFCYAQMQASDGGEITQRNAFDFLEDAAAIGVKGVSLISDGESTVVPWYAESIKHGSRCGLSIGVSTNGLKFKRDMLERILPHLSYLRFNFSAGEEGRYAEIMGVKRSWYHQVIQNVRDAVEIKRRDNLKVTINLQMVTMPQFHDQILPLARLAKDIRPDYLIFKHCADNASGDLGVDYKQYDALYPAFREAEAMSDDEFRVVVKWSRIEDEGKRAYTRCYGPPFIIQMSGNGLIAPCGFLFNEKYKAFHIGNITKERFKDIWASDRYWEVMSYLASDHFNPQSRCGPNCLQDRTNDFLFKYVNGTVPLPTAPAPPHMAFL
jgi:MoaA/NifB/PqqE/SkfB family radical SAM enzyme